MTFRVFNISLTLPHYILITFCKYLIKHKIFSFRYKEVVHKLKNVARKLSV